MQALVTRLTFDGADAADEEMSELRRQADDIRTIDGFQALYGIRASPTEVLIVRVFETAAGIGQSLASPLRTDLAERFAAPPLRMSGEVQVAASR